MKTELKKLKVKFEGKLIEIDIQKEYLSMRISLILSYENLLLVIMYLLL